MRNLEKQALKLIKKEIKLKAVIAKKINERRKLREEIQEMKIKMDINFELAMTQTRNWTVEKKIEIIDQLHDSIFRNKEEN